MCSSPDARQRSQHPEAPPNRLASIPAATRSCELRLEEPVGAWMAWCGQGEQTMPNTVSTVDPDVLVDGLAYVESPRRRKAGCGLPIGDGRDRRCRRGAQGGRIHGRDRGQPVRREGDYEPGVGLLTGNRPTGHQRPSPTAPHHRFGTPSPERCATERVARSLGSSCSADTSKRRPRRGSSAGCLPDSAPGEVTAIYGPTPWSGRSVG